MKPEFHRCREDSQSVNNGSSEVDRRRFREIAGRTRYLADAKPERRRLREHLIVEHEIIGAFIQWKRFENVTSEGAIACVVLGKLDSEHDVLERREQTIEIVLIARHSTL